MQNKDGVIDKEEFLAAVEQGRLPVPAVEAVLDNTLDELKAADEAWTAATHVHYTCFSEPCNNPQLIMCACASE